MYLGQKDLGNLQGLKLQGRSMVDRSGLDGFRAEGLGRLAKVKIAGCVPWWTTADQMNLGQKDVGDLQGLKLQGRSMVDNSGSHEFSAEGHGLGAAGSFHGRQRRIRLINLGQKDLGHAEVQVTEACMFHDVPRQIRLISGMLRWKWQQHARQRTDGAVGGACRHKLQNIQK